MTYDLDTVARRLASSIGDTLCDGSLPRARYDEAEDRLTRLFRATGLQNAYEQAWWQPNLLLYVDHKVQEIRSMWCGECWTKRNDCVHGAQWWLAEARAEMDRAYWKHKYATEDLDRARLWVIDAEKEVKKHVR